jgi:ATP-binding cassette, subfamily C (CFTR/MRP), member 1
VLLVLFCVQDNVTTSATIPAAVVSVVTTTFILVLSAVHHTKSVRPSLLLSAFILLTALFDCARARTLWNVASEKSLPLIFTLALAVKVSILATENMRKHRSPRNDSKYAPEELAGLFGRTFFLWLLGLLIRGFRRQLSPGDLDPIDRTLLSKDLQLQFKRVRERVDRKIITLTWGSICTIILMGE